MGRRRALFVVAVAAHTIALPSIAKSQDSIDGFVVDRATLDNGVRVVLTSDATLLTVTNAV